jgi:hypothetical protein
LGKKRGRSENIRRENGFPPGVSLESMFGSVVAGAFQITFRAKMHANDFFHFLKIIFDISTSKRSKPYKPY